MNPDCCSGSEIRTERSNNLARTLLLYLPCDLNDLMAFFHLRSLQNQYRCWLGPLLRPPRLGRLPPRCLCLSLVSAGCLAELTVEGIDCARCSTVAMKCSP